MQDIPSLRQEIRRLKEERNAILLVHNYQPPEIQDIADLTGDSLELSRAAAKMTGDVIVFCGVDFMAETAAILSPDKTVLLPAEDACCPMAQMISADELREAKERYPDAAVVCYVNTTAEVKAESDICCTSSNAVKVVNSLEQETVIFVPTGTLAGMSSASRQRRFSRGKDSALCTTGSPPGTSGRQNSCTRKPSSWCTPSAGRRLSTLRTTWQAPPGSSGRSALQGSRSLSSARRPASSTG